MTPDAPSAQPQSARDRQCSDYRAMIEREIQLGILDENGNYRRKAPQPHQYLTSLPDTEAHLALAMIREHRTGGDTGERIVEGGIRVWPNGNLGGSTSQHSA